MEKFENLSLKMDRNALVIGLLSRHAQEWNKVSKFQAAVDRLISNQEKLVKLHAILIKDIAEIEKAKHEQRKILEDRTMMLVRILQVFAHDKKKVTLQDKLYHLTYEYVENCSDPELVKITKKIWLMANKFGGYATTFANKIKAASNPDNFNAANKFENEFGLGPDMIKDLEDAILNFIKAIFPYNKEMAEKEMVAMKMKQINKKTKKLFANKIDRFVLMFENKSPGFCKEYHDLRVDLLYKQEKETINRETESQKLLLDKNELVETKSKAKNKQKVNSETI